jgi:Leucine-rich repeat (LRR) protein
MNTNHFKLSVLLICLYSVTNSSNSGTADKLVIQKWVQFDSPSDVRELKLSGKGIETINETAFSGMIKLEMLDLSHNKLTSLPANVFRGNY